MNEKILETLAHVLLASLVIKHRHLCPWHPDMGIVTGCRSVQLGPSIHSPTLESKNRLVLSSFCAIESEAFGTFCAGLVDRI